MTAREWLVVIAVDGGARIPPEHQHRLENIPADSAIMPVNVTMLTEYWDVDPAGRLPGDLCFVVELRASDLETAADTAAQIVAGLIPMLAFTTNVGMGDPRTIAVIEATPGLEEREYLQRTSEFGFSLSKALSPGRRIPFDMVTKVLNAVFALSDTDRVGRAVTQYALALTHWSSGTRVMALEHLYIAVETLGPVLTKARMARTGESEVQLAEELGVDTTMERWRWKRDFDAAVRRELVCKGRAEVFGAAERASTGLEHGFGKLPDIRRAANAYTAELMDVVRSAIVEALALDPELSVQLLEKHPIDRTSIAQTVHGTWHGSPTDLAGWAAPGGRFPRLQTTVRIDAVEHNPDGSITMSPKVDVTVECAEGVTFTPSAHAVETGLNDPQTFGVSSESVKWEADSIEAVADPHNG